MKAKNNQQSAFTLIELLVVISVMLIFIGGTLAQYNTNTEQTKLKNEGKKLVDVLELAKKKALSADLVGSCANFTGYQVKLSSSGYSLIFCCDFACSDPDSVHTNVNAYAFNNANITISLGTGNYDFSPLMNNPKFYGDKIQLKNSVINKCVNISITSVGIIDLDETLVDC